MPAIPPAMPIAGEIAFSRDYYISKLLLTEGALAGLADLLEDACGTECEPTRALTPKDIAQLFYALQALTDYLGHLVGGLDERIEKIQEALPGQESAA